MTTATEYLAARGFDGKAAEHHDFVELGVIAAKKATGYATAAIAIHYHDFDGEPTGHTRWRFLDPSATRDGRKFHNLPGKPPQLYPAKPMGRLRWSKIAKDVRHKIVITESEMKAARAALAGLNAIGLGGVAAWQVKGVPLPAWKLVEWKGRQVEIANDYGVLTNKEVKRWTVDLGEYLASQGAIVTIKVPYDVTGRGETGLDDFLTARGREAYDALVGYPLDGEVIAKWKSELAGAGELPELKFGATPAEWLSQPLPPMEFTIDGVVPRGVVGLIVAEGGTGKTYLALRAAIAVASGEPFLGRSVREGRAVFVALEDPADVIRRRIFKIHGNMRAGLLGKADREKRLAKKLCENLVVESLVGQQMHLITADHGVAVQAPALDALVARLKSEQVELLVLDPMARLHGLNENDNSVGTAFVNAAEKIAREVGCTVLVSHHTGKQNAANQNRGAYSARGASGISDAARVVLRMSQLDEKDAARITNVTDAERKRGIVLFEQAKSNYSGKAEGIHLKRDEFGDLDLFAAAFENAEDAYDGKLARLRAWFKAKPEPTSKSSFSEDDKRREKIFGRSAARLDVRSFVAEAIKRGNLVPAGSTSGGKTYAFVEVSDGN